MGDPNVAPMTTVEEYEKMRESVVANTDTLNLIQHSQGVLIKGSVPLPFYFPSVSPLKTLTDDPPQRSMLYEEILESNYDHKMSSLLLLALTKPPRPWLVLMKRLQTSKAI
jgi:hypothetical protein